MEYVELQITSNFSFLTGGSHPEELVAQAAALGYKAIAITDHNTVAGIVRAHVAAKELGLQFIPACRLDLQDGPSLLAYPTDRAAYGRMCTLLTTGNLRAEKGQCKLYREDVYQYQEGIIFVIADPAIVNEYDELEQAFVEAAKDYRANIKGDLFLSAVRRYDQDDFMRLFLLNELAENLDIPLVATNDVLYHNPERRQLQDVLTCVHEKCDINTAGFKLQKNAEQYLKPPEEMARLFRRYPQALRHSAEIAEKCKFSLDALRFEFPEELTSEGRTPQQELEYLAYKHAHETYGQHLPEKISKAIENELMIIGDLDCACFFLQAYDLIRFARRRNILCQGRGSAANSTICFCLGITSVDPTRFELLFERFFSPERKEPPDIDIDFEHERREEVIQYIFDKYGRDRAAIVATVTQQRSKGAIRDTGKAMGLSLDAVERLSASLWEFDRERIDIERLQQQGLDPRDQLLMKTVELSTQMMGFPRQLGQHTGGFVITRGKLHELCPVLNARMENRTTIEWNKDDIDALGILKIDVLALGMLTCIRKAFEFVELRYGRTLTLANIPQEDAGVYQMISEADTLGVFQIESRAQMAMLPRLQPRTFYDLVIEVALVRPGPIQGNMVHPYLKRRTGEEPVTYPSEELKEILGRTLGVPLFQEQAMKIAIVAAEFTPAEADKLRRSMATFKFKGLVNQFEEKLIEGMVRRGYERRFAEDIFHQLEGFGSYGFPESHAASFALLVYVSCYLKFFYPEVFAAALLNSQPMGFYAPDQIVTDARRHGVIVRPIDINSSEWDNTLEEMDDKYHAIRLGFRHIRGIKEIDMELLVAARNNRYKRISELYDVGVPAAALEKLAEADAFKSLKLGIREAMWEVAALKDTPTGLFKGEENASAREAQIKLPFITDAQRVHMDHVTTGISLNGNLVQFVRPRLSRCGICSSIDIKHTVNGTPVRFAGLVRTRQRPATSNGVVFYTIEDELGSVNVVIFEKIFDKYRRALMQGQMLLIEGLLQREGMVIHVIAKRCYNLNALIQDALKDEPDQAQIYSMEPSKQLKVVGMRDNIDTFSFPKSRNFK